MKALGVQIASEKQLSKVSKEVIGENLAGEAVPFYFALKSGIYDGVITPVGQD